MIREGIERFEVFITASNVGSVIGQTDTTVIEIDDTDLDCKLTSRIFQHLVLNT